MTYTFQDFAAQYKDNDACIEALFKMRYPYPKCQKCGEVGKYHRRKDRPTYVCQCGKHEISVKKGTIFEKSDTDLAKWFFAIFLMSQSKNGVSALELKRQIGVGSYQTALRMQKQIRSMMMEMPAYLTGEVEADETYIGGKRKGKRGRGAAGKTIVFGTLQRKGKINTHVVPNVKAATLHPHINDNVAKGADLITDELRSYKKIASIMDMNHRTVEHGAGQYAKPDGTHTNSIEGFWSQLKRSIHGTYHVVSPKYLPLYVSEFAFRYNYRSSSTHLFDLLLKRVVLPHGQVANRIGAYQWPV